MGTEVAEMGTEVAEMGTEVAEMGWNRCALMRRHRCALIDCTDVH